MLLYRIICIYYFLCRRYDLTRRINPIIEEFVSYGCVSDEQQLEILNGLEAFRNRIRGLLNLV